MANYAYYCLHKFKMLPSTFMELDDAEKGFIIAAINEKVESEKKERARIKKK